MSLIKDKYKEYKNIFLDEFSSIKLAITLLAFLSITTLIGTILPQEPMVGTESILQKYGLEKYKLYKTLGLTDVFHSWWYLALLTTFGLNLTIASFRRVFPKWKLALAWPSYIKEENILKLPITTEVLSENLKIDEIEKTIKSLSYKTKKNENQIVAVKGGWHRLGASVTHIGILVLLIGSTVSILTGYNGRIQLSEGEGFYIADLGQSSNQTKSSEKNNWLAPISKMPIWFGNLPRHLIKVNKTWRENYPNGLPKQWHTNLTIHDGSKKIIHEKTIHVNDPIQFMGLDIYQSSWGRFADIGFNNQRSTFPIETIDNKELIYLPITNDIGFKFEIQNSNSDTLHVYSVLASKDIQEKFIGKIKPDEKLSVGPIEIEYFGSKTLTGLQFKSNPGDLLIYPGVIFMIIGVLIAFGSKNQLWIIVKENKMLIGGLADRSMVEITKDIKYLISKVGG